MTFKFRNDTFCLLIKTYNTYSFVYNEFGLKIKQLRLLKNISQEQLSFDTGFHRTYIGMIERGERNISLINMAVFTKVFKINLSELLDLSTVNPNHSYESYQIKAEKLGFFKIDLETKRKILDILNISHRFIQSFDLIYIPTLVGKVIDQDAIEIYLEDMILVELKTTKKYLPKNRKGFFFGATENGFSFGQILADKFRFCFVSLHEKGSSFSFQTIAGLEKRIRNKGIQYQINL